MYFSNLFLNEACKKKNLLKVITGLSNFDINEIIEITKSTDISCGTYLDIAADKEIIKEVRKYTYLPICVSSVESRELYKATLEKVDLLEIGNFDSIYSKGVTLSEYEILNLVREVIDFWPSKNICVTIPYTLSLDNQIELSLKLQNSGVKVLQTEGINNTNNLNFSDNSVISNLIDSAASSLSSTYVISRFVNIPIIAASGISAISAKLAILYGASGVGLCTAIKNSIYLYNKAYYIKQIVDTISHPISYSNNKLLSSIQVDYRSLYFV